MFSDTGHFQMFVPATVHTICKILYNTLKIFLAIDVIGIKSFDQFNDFSNKIDFFFAIFDNHLFSSLGVFIEN